MGVNDLVSELVTYYATILTVTFSLKHNPSTRHWSNKQHPDVSDFAKEGVTYVTK